MHVTPNGPQIPNSRFVPPRFQAGLSATSLLEVKRCFDKEKPVSLDLAHSGADGAKDIPGLDEWAEMQASMQAGVIRWSEEFHRG